MLRSATLPFTQPTPRLYRWGRTWQTRVLAPSRLNRGFTLVEVTVGLMVTMVFISITMQVLMTAALFQARADQFNQAVNWIQEDYETVFNRATQYEMAAEPYSQHCQATTPTQGLAARFINTNAPQGLGGASASVGPRLFGGRSFQLFREASYANSDDPSKLLNLTYRVIPENGNVPMAQFRTEVLVYAALKCPN